MVAILVLLLAWSLLPSESVKVTNTIGVGPICGRTTCARHGHCGYSKGEKSCICNRDYYGIGSFVCVPQNEKYCSVFNDPAIKGFDGSHVRVPGEQMTFAAHIGTKLCYCNGTRAVVTSKGSCDVRVYLWYCRRRGKFFVCGTVVKIIVFLKDTILYHTTRIQARARKGHYVFKEEGQRDEFGNGQFGDPIETRIPGVGRIKTVYDHHDNFAIVDIGVCGIKVGLRPADSVWNPSITPAGLVVTTTNECEPNYLSVEQTICAPPFGKGPSLENQIYELSQEVKEPVSKEELACLKVICGDVNQNFPGAQTNMNNLHETCNSCDKKTLIRAIKHCCFILHQPLFVNCYDRITPSNPRGSNKLINLLDECLFSQCSESSDMCKLVQCSIEDSGCAVKIPRNQYTILNSTCDF